MRKNKQNWKHYGPQMIIPNFVILPSNFLIQMQQQFEMYSKPKIDTTFSKKKTSVNLKILQAKLFCCLLYATIFWVHKSLVQDLWGQKFSSGKNQQGSIIVLGVFIAPQIFKVEISRKIHLKFDMKKITLKLLKAREIRLSYDGITEILKFNRKRGNFISCSCTIFFH